MDNMDMEKMEMEKINNRIQQLRIRIPKKKVSNDDDHNDNGARMSKVRRQKLVWEMLVKRGRQGVIQMRGGGEDLMTVLCGNPTHEVSYGSILEMTRTGFVCEGFLTEELSARPVVIKVQIFKKTAVPEPIVREAKICQKLASLGIAIPVLRMELHKFTSRLRCHVIVMEKAESDVYNALLLRKEKEKNKNNSPVSNLADLANLYLRLLFCENVSKLFERTHDASIAQLDIAPQNMVIRQDGKIALIDFNLAGEFLSDALFHINAGKQTPWDRKRIGRAYYAHPDLWDFPEPVNAFAADKWSLAIVLVLILAQTREEPNRDRIAQFGLADYCKNLPSSACSEYWIHLLPMLDNLRMNKASIASVSQSIAEVRSRVLGKLHEWMFQEVALEIP